MKKNSPLYFAPALEKGLDVLEALSTAQTPQSLSDLARTLKRTSSELFRMISALEKRGYIARDPVSEGYHLTLKLYELAHTHSPVDQLLRAATQPMRELAETLQESCHLCVLSGRMLTVIAQAESPEPVRLSIEVGYQAQPLDTVSGRVLVAFLNQGEQEAFLSADSFYRSLKPRKQKLLQSELRAIRRNGFYIAPSSRRTGVDVSGLVGNANIGMIAALGVPFIAGGPNDGQERSLIPIIQKYSDRITALLGLVPRED